MDIGATQPLSFDERFAAQVSAATSHLKQCEAEKKLLIAVLKDAILDYKKYRWSGNARFKEAQRWIFGDDTDRLFAFQTVCAMLSLSADRIRKDLRSLSTEHGSEGYYPPQYAAPRQDSGRRTRRFYRADAIARRR
jgi:hypothetical protein